MKKKTSKLCTVLPAVIIIAVLLICAITYFKPISLSDIASENNRIVMILNEFGVRNGAAYIDSTDYQSITPEQKSSIIALFEQYTYRRTFGTLFSDGSLSDMGDQVLYIYVYDGNSLVSNIFVSTSGKIAVNEKSYSMKNAEHFIEQIIEIVE